MKVRAIILTMTLTIPGCTSRAAEPVESPRCDGGWLLKAEANDAATHPLEFGAMACNKAFWSSFNEMNWPTELKEQIEKIREATALGSFDQGRAAAGEKVGSVAEAEQKQAAARALAVADGRFQNNSPDGGGIGIGSAAPPETNLAPRGSAPAPSSNPVLAGAGIPGSSAYLYRAGRIDGVAAAGPAPDIYNPSNKVKAPYLIVLDQRLISHGASPAAVQNLHDHYRDLIEQLPVGVLRNLVRNEVYLAIIPKNKKMTDLPEFMNLRGKRTFDGRLWDDVRGCAGETVDGHKHYVAVGEDNLTRYSAIKSRPGDFDFYHEYGHAVKEFGLPSSSPKSSGMAEELKLAVLPERTQRRVQEIYDESMKRPQKTGLGKYADSNADEFFAQATAAFFGDGDTRDDKPWDWKMKGPAGHKAFVLYRVQENARDLYKANPEIFKLCWSLYGPPGRSLQIDSSTPSF
jgi:hypothetical protein